MDLGENNSLTLTIYRRYFLDILFLRKKVEYRSRSNRYDKIFSTPPKTLKLINGYGHHRPWLLVKIVKINKTKRFWEISLGQIIDTGNLKTVVNISKCGGLPSFRT